MKGDLHLHQRMMTGLGGGCDIDTRTLFLVGEIEENLAYKFIASFWILDSTKGDINIVLCSGGGHEEAGYAIYDTIKGSRNNVTILGLGSVQSIASLIIQAGDRRLLSPETRFMVHNGDVTVEGSIPSDQLVSIGKEVERNNERYYKILSESSGQNLDKIKKLCDVETYMSAEEAIVFGFADDLIQYNKKKKRKKKK